MLHSSIGNDIIMTQEPTITMPYDGCYGDQSPSWNEIQYSLDKYKLLTGILITTIVTNLIY
jgi:hypothetical protein